jgi:hypothetical protein
VQIIVGTLLPILTAVFNVKFQMLGGNPCGLVQEEIFDLINKLHPPRIPIGTQVRLSDEAAANAEISWPLKPGETATLYMDDGSSNPYQVRTDDGMEHSYWFLLNQLVPADNA